MELISRLSSKGTQKKEMRWRKMGQDAAQMEGMETRGPRLPALPGFTVLRNKHQGLRMTVK